MLGEGEKMIPARVTNASHQGSALISTSVPTGTAIKIELDDAYVPAEAVYCRRLRAYAPNPLGGEGLHTVNDRQTQNR